MPSNSMSKYEARAAIIKAMAHPTRLFIIEKLSQKTHCVCELKELIDADTSTVSKHLSVLKNAGIVSDQKKGLQVYYSLKAPCILNFIGCIESVINDRINEQIAQLQSTSSPEKSPATK